MNRRFLFLSGECSVSVPLVFLNDDWAHTQIARKIIKNENGTYSRFNINEMLDGFLYYAEVESKFLRRGNLKLFAENNVPCWPSPEKILRIDDRFTLLRECVNAGFVDHEVQFVKRSRLHTLSYKHPYVLKVGNQHQGTGKFLVQPGDEEAVTDYNGVASAEPFFDGMSVRILFIGAEQFALRLENTESWIKNSSGAEVFAWNDAPKEMFSHAKKVRDYFDLEICGIDYIVDSSNKFHFLEYNSFPGISATEEISAAASKLFAQKMKLIESEATKTAL